MHLSNHLCLGLIALLAQPVSAFVLLSGPEEAKLNASVDQPVIQFHVGDGVPRISGKEKFLGGKYAELDDIAFWHALINEAMAPWNAVSTSYVRLELTHDPNAKADEKDQVHSIVVDSVNLTASAFARPENEDGVITDCDITIGNKKSEASSLAYTMMHELGHCLGLGHNHTNYDSVMGYSRESRSLRLGLDDRAGITYLYPNPDLDKPQETLGCAVIAASTRYSWFALAFLCAPLMLVFTRRFTLKS